jgi:hypothetical protein
VLQPKTEKSNQISEIGHQGGPGYADEEMDLL